MPMPTQFATSLEELMRDALEARAEVARLEKALAEARGRSREVEKALSEHPDVENDRAFMAGHLFEWEGERVLIWPCRHFTIPAAPSRDFA